MTRFGESILYRYQLSLSRRFLFSLFGLDFIGATIRFSHFSCCLKKILKKDQLDNSTILDAGSGTGDFSFYLAQQFPEANVYAYDIKKDIIEENKKIAKQMGINNLTFATKDLLLSLDEKEKYDSVFSIGTLIYFSKKETKQILENLVRSIKPNGFLYLDLPQEDFLEVNIISTEHYSTYYKQLKDENSGDLYSYNEMRDLLRELGMNILFYNKSFGYFGKFAWEFDNMLRELNMQKVRFCLFPLMKLCALLDGKIDNTKGCCFVILAKKL